MPMKTTNDIRPYKFSTLEIARNFRDRAIKSLALILGDDRKVWVVTHNEAGTLVGLGFTEVT